MSSQVASTVVATHDWSDFDALAAQVLACRLHPGAVIVASPGTQREVRPYLALHRDRLAMVRVSDVAWESVRELIVVDTRSRSRLRHIEPILERYGRGDATLRLSLYDHHAARVDDLVGHVEVIEPVGAVTTLLIERLRKQGSGLDRFEATLCALAIHCDTGSLAFPSAHARDASALAWVMEHGVQVEQLNRYLHLPLRAEQRDVLVRLLVEARHQRLGSLRVATADLRLRAVPAGLDEVVTRAHELLAVQVLVVVVSKGGDKFNVIARAAGPGVDLGAVLAELGGGGHASAAAATVRRREHEAVSAAAIIDRALELLAEQAPRSLLVRDVMTSPPVVVSRDASIPELQGLLGISHTGACVLDDDRRLVGIVSRRDLFRDQEPSRRRFEGSAPIRVAQIMSHPVRTTDEEATVEDALSAIEANDIGRLPVLRGGQLVGIVSRGDLLAALYPDGN